MSKNTIFTGAGAALVTPFNDDYSVNYDALDRLCEFQIAGGTDAIIVCGTTGEASTLSREEHLSVVERVVKTVNGRIPVIAGSGSNDTAFAIKTSQAAQELGADALLLVTPYYNKTSQRGLIKHYSAIAEAVDLPLIIYSIASRTGVNILPETCVELAKIPNIVAIKEASDDVSQVTKIASLCGDELDIYSGCDDLILPIMSVGAKGVISVLSNIMPGEAHDLAASFLEGNWERAKQLQLELYDLCKALFCDVNPMPVKAALNLMGFDVGPCRLPLCDMAEDTLEKLRSVMVKHGLIK